MRLTRRALKWHVTHGHNLWRKGQHHLAQAEWGKAGYISRILKQRALKRLKPPKLALPEELKDWTKDTPPKHPPAETITSPEYCNRCRKELTRRSDIFMHKGKPYCKDCFEKIRPKKVYVDYPNLPPRAKKWIKEED